MTRPLRLLLPAALLGTLLGCVHTPPVHPRAEENNRICAQYIVEGNLIQADVYCDLALEFSPQFADAWVNKGMIRLRRNQMDPAKECFIKALRYNQESAQAYNDLGYIYLQEEAFGKAHDNFQRALKVNPDMSEARWNLARAYMGLKKYEEAKKELRTVIAVAPNLAEPHNSLGILLAKEKDYDQAIANFSQAIELAPDFAEAYLNLGSVYAEQGQWEKAADEFTSCLRADPENIACRNNLPIANRKKALSDPALQRGRDETLSNPTAAGFYQQGQQYHEQGLRAEEQRAYKRCVQIDGKFVPCHYGLYLIFREDQDTHNANIACKNVLKFGASEEFPKEVDDCQKQLGSRKP